MPINELVPKTRLDGIRGASRITADERCEFRWNSEGSAALALASADVDKSGGSYYGKKQVFLLPSDFFVSK